MQSALFVSMAYPTFNHPDGGRLLPQGEDDDFIEIIF